jgi:deoxyribodipyrimidine photo-lyase
MTTRLVWFRRDLRIHDHPALKAACRGDSARVIGLYLATPQQWEQHSMAPRQAWFIRQHVAALGRSLAELGIPLQVAVVPDYRASIDWIDAFCQRHRVTELFYHYQYELDERRRDAALERALDGKVMCQGFDDGVLLAPGSVTTGSGTSYQVFTPFSRAVIRRLSQALPECVAPPSACGTPLRAPDIPDFDYPEQTVSEADFPVGEVAAQARLAAFCHQPAAEYEAQRDFPARPGTSRLSPWLAVGALSPRQCLAQLLENHPDALTGGPGAVWLKELIWRDFYRQVMVAHPEMSRYQPLIPWTAEIDWRDDPQGFQAWCEGRTGFPIVDAAMRQLNATGWMHNRLRMIAASFLIKDLRIDWRQGERYFMSQLIDGDLASNNGGWQWAASTGCDAQPWFRIFNPTTQGQKFDRDGAFVRHWLPALDAVPGSALHVPWEWADKQGMVLDYPRPLVDHKQARETTLAAYQAARNKESSR